jgi:hypothetical protein
MSDISTHLPLPYILASQAQKHVTHNEALRLLDTMVQLSVLDRTRTVPPFSPVDGDRHVVASGATGPWSGWDQNVAFWVDGVWMRLVPRPGWLGWIADEAVFIVWNGSAWNPNGSETLGMLDAVAMGPGRMLVIDHKTGPAPDPKARFASFWPQLAAYADALRLTFPAHQLHGVAIHWMNEGTLSFRPLEPETVA